MRRYVIILEVFVMMLVGSLFTGVSQLRADLACGTETCPEGQTFGRTFYTCRPLGSDTGLCYDDSGSTFQSYCRLDGNTCTLRICNQDICSRINPGGCVSYSAPCNTKIDASFWPGGVLPYIGCCPAAAPMPQITAQGFKNIMPANTTDPLVNNLQVSLNNPASNTNTNPYFLSWTAQAGVSRTVSVPSVPAGYNVASSLCSVNNFGCHGWYLDNPAYQSGNARTIEDDLYRNCGSSTCYADLWWHFCQSPSMPNVTSYGGGTPANPVNVCGGGPITVTWNPPSTGGNVVGNYLVRIDDTSDVWNNCANVPSSEDRCERVTAGSYTFTPTPGKTYNFWVHAQDMCSGIGPAFTTWIRGVSAPVAPTLNSVTNPAVLGPVGSLILNWTDNSSNETGFIIENGATSYSVPANTTTYTNTPLNCTPPANTYTYTVSAVNDNNPVACRASTSNSIGPVTANCCPALANPTNLAPAGSLCVSGASLNTNLTWTAPASGNPTSYTVRLVNTTDGVVVVNNAVTASTSYPVTLLSGKNYTMTISATNSCGSISSASINFNTAGGPPAATLISAQDVGLAVNLVWTAASDPQYFRIFKNGAYYGSNLAGSTRTYLDPTCVLSSYRVDSFIDGNPPGCEMTAGANTLMVECEPLNTSWFSASGGGNLVAATGEIRSSIPSTTYLPYLSLAGNGYPGVAIASQFGMPLTQINVRNWVYDISTPWSVLLTERENKYEGMKERIWSRVTPHSISTANLDQGGFDTEYGTATTFGTTGVKIMHWNSGSTLSIGNGNLNLNGRRALIFAEGSVTLDGEIRWDQANPGSLTVVARGDISINPSVGTVGLTMDVDIREPTVPAHIMGIYYAGGVFRTGTFNNPSVRDNILKIDGTIVGMQNVLLQRRNVGRYPVEFFNFQPGLITELSGVGLRQKVVQELLNP